MTEPQFNGYPLQFVRSLLDLYDSSQTECDGMVRLCATALAHHAIPFTGHLGRVLVQHEDDSYQALPLHFWLTLSDDDQSTLVVDYRLQCYVSRTGVGHGVFSPSQVSNVSYLSDSQFEMGVLPNFLVRELQLGWQHLQEKLPAGLELGDAQFLNCDQT